MEKKLKILHVTSTYFSPDSVMGGGERYVEELAKAMSLYADVKIMTFGKREKKFSVGSVEVIVKRPWFYIKNNLLNPFGLNFYKEFKEADIIHIHQIYTVLAEISILWARLLNKPVFLTDHGGGGRTYLTRLKITKLANGLLPVSEYSSNKLQSLHPVRQVIYGGVDEKKYHPLELKKMPNKIIAVGRILPHKGFHHLIKALENENLTIIGQVKDEEYYRFLNKLSENKNVQFIHDANDEQLIHELGTSSLAVFPSTNIGAKGELLAGEPELLGLAPLEAMAMNIPTIVSNIGAYPEVCMNKEIFLFKHGDWKDLRKKLDQINGDRNLDNLNFSEHVKNKFTWDKAATKCLSVYKENGVK